MNTDTQPRKTCTCQSEWFKRTGWALMAAAWILIIWMGTLLIVGAIRTL